MLIDNPPAEITDDLWMLGTRAYPLYLFRGPREATIVEGGIGAMGPLLREQLQPLEIPPDSVKQVVITHAHPDHVMSVPLFRKMFSGAEVLASEAAASTLASEKAVSLFCKLDDALCGALRQSGVIDERHRRDPLPEERIAVDRTLKEGDTVTAGEFSLRVLATPGHSDCSLSFYDADRGVLLISDASGYYMPQHDAWWPNYFADYAAYLDSIRRLAALEVEILCLSHNAAIKGSREVRSYFDGALAATKQYHQRILDEARSGKSVRQIAQELGSEVHEKTQVLPLDFFQKNCGLLVKLSLRHEGISPDN